LFSTSRLNPSGASSAAGPFGIAGVVKLTANWIQSCVKCRSLPYDDDGSIYIRSRVNRSMNFFKCVHIGITRLHWRSPPETNPGCYNFDSESRTTVSPLISPRHRIASRRPALRCDKISDCQTKSRLKSSVVSIYDIPVPSESRQSHIVARRPCGHWLCPVGGESEGSG
jgi:hypothetical protein